MLSKLLQPIRQQVLQYPFRFLAGVAVGSALLWVYWPTLRSLQQIWASDAKYSHGYLVPAFALALLWWRWEQAAGVVTFRPSGWGVVLLLAGLAVRAVGTYLFVPWFSALSIVPCVAGVCVLFGGWPALRWAWPAVAFLVFMLPLPDRLEVALAHPLQRIATRVSTYALQTCGFAAHAQGNVILFGDVKIGVAEACSGLSMLVIFFAISTAVTLVVQRRWLDKGLILASAIPIALVCNIARITVTGICYAKFGKELGDHEIFHKRAGLVMMPMALGLLWVELQLLSWVLLERQAGPLGLALGPGTVQPGALPPGQTAAAGQAHAMAGATSHPAV